MVNNPESSCSTFCKSNPNCIWYSSYFLLYTLKNFIQLFTIESKLPLVFDMDTWCRQQHHQHMLYLIQISIVQHLLRSLIGSIFIQSNACFLKTCLILLSSNMVFVENFELDFPGLLRENFQDCSRSKISPFIKASHYSQPFPVFLYFIFGFCIDSGLFILFIRVQRIASKPKKSVSSLSVDVSTHKDIYTDGH